MMTELEQALVAVAGVSRAQVDATQGEGVTLHVELDEDADRDSVAAAVDVVLRRHGLRSRTREASAVGDEVGEPAPTGLPAAAGDGVGERVEDSDRNEVDDRVPRDGVEEVVLGYAPGRVSVLVRSLAGREATSDVVNREAALDQAIAGAVGELLGHRVVPHVLEVSRRGIASRRAVTVVLDLGEDLAIGSSFEGDGAPLGMARAVWNALLGD